jgi:hypothetical protein
MDTDVHKNIRLFEKLFKPNVIKIMMHFLPIYAKSESKESSEYRKCNSMQML